MSYHDCIKRGIDEYHFKDKKKYDLAVKTLRLLREGFYDDCFSKNFCVQKGWGTLDIYDAYNFAMLRTHLFTGDLYHVSIPIGFEPSSNSNKYENNKKLESIWLAGPPGGDNYIYCHAEFFGQVAELGDGNVWLRQPVFANVYNIENESSVKILNRGVCASLEVGTTKSTTTIFHLFSGGSLARWPYNCKKIDILIPTKEFLTNRHSALDQRLSTKKANKENNQMYMF